MTSFWALVLSRSSSGEASHAKGLSHIMDKSWTLPYATSQESSTPNSKGGKQAHHCCAMIRFAYRLQNTQTHMKKSRSDSSKDTMVTSPSNQWLHLPSALPSSAFGFQSQDHLMFQYGCHNPCHQTLISGSRKGKGSNSQFYQPLHGIFPEVHFYWVSHLG